MSTPPIATPAAVTPAPPAGERLPLRRRLGQAAAVAALLLSVLVCLPLVALCAGCEAAAEEELADRGFEGPHS